MVSEPLKPNMYTYSKIITSSTSEAQLTLNLIEFRNAVISSLYIEEPKLGSLTLGFSQGKLVDRSVIFQGKNEEMASSLALILAKQTGKFVYSSVNLPSEWSVSLEFVRELVDQYKKEKHEAGTK